MKKNDVASFFYYMWNAWDEEECKRAFSGAGWKHFWSKWCGYYRDYGSNGAISMFFANLSDQYQDMLVERAISMYDRKYKIK